MKCNITVKGFLVSEGNLYNLYREEYLDMHNYLRGDYLVTIEDGDKTVYISDFAGSKSYYKVPRNSTVVIEDNKMIYRKDNIHTTDLIYSPPQGQPKRNDYDKLFDAILDAVKIRIPNEDYTLALSSGHDSGVIANSCLLLKSDPKVLYAKGHENSRVLDRRIKYFDSTEFGSNFPMNPHELVASKSDTRVLLSGLGADELYVSQDFELLEDFFRDAHIGYDMYGLDVRFPLNDPLVYREYMLLNDDLKGTFNHKTPFTKFMERTGFPVNYEKKSSFYLW